ncbi:MAG: hypothetical protein KatS3mg095_0560 [Candidatus Parcubacteria bacterium]|nr:MAG: hypothetical protein KatS3mg095_0560 [Candidatus Parcubacteria bacterium]
MKNYYFLLLFLFCSLPVTTFGLDATNHNTILQKIIENNSKKNSISSLKFDIKINESITGKGFKKLINDLTSFSQENFIPNEIKNVNFTNQQSYISLEGFFSKNYFNLKLGITDDNKDLIKLDLEAIPTFNKNLLYLNIKNLDLNLDEQVSLLPNASDICKQNVSELAQKIDNFLDQKIKNKWIVIPGEFTLNLDSSFLDALTKNDIFTFQKAKSLNKDLDKFKIIVNDNNLINLIKLVDDTLAAEKQKLLTKIFKILFEKEIGEIYLDKKSYLIKEINFNLKQTKFAKTRYDLVLNFKLNIVLNPKITKKIATPSKYIEVSEILDNFLKFLENEHSLISSINENCLNFLNDKNLF